MLFAIAIVWVGFAALYKLGGYRLVFVLIIGAIVFLGMGLIIGGCVEVFRDLTGLSLYGDGPGDQQTFYGYLFLVTGVVSLIIAINATKNPNAKRKRSRKSQSFRLWRKPKRRTARLVKA